MTTSCITVTVTVTHPASDGSSTGTVCNLRFPLAGTGTIIGWRANDGTYIVFFPTLGIDANEYPSDLALGAC